jgi:hypothetical protein
MNLPKDENGRDVPLGDFDTMDRKSFIIWRDHLYNSVTEGSGCKHPFRLVRTNGEAPILSVYRMGSNAEAEAEAEATGKKGKRGGKGGKGGKKGGKGSGKGKEKKSKEAVSDDEVSASTHLALFDNSKQNMEHEGQTNASNVSIRPKPHAAATPCSPYLQLPSMSQSTLPEEWRNPGFKADAVSGKLYQKRLL